MRKLAKLSLFAGIVLFASCAAPQVKSKVKAVNASSLREAIADRTISWAGVNYRYDYIPFGKEKTLLAAGENWGPTVNADLQGICRRLGGKDLECIKDPFSGKIKPLKPARSWSFHWACVGGKDPFEVVVYRPNEYGIHYNLLRPIQPDWYIEVKHKKQEPVILSAEMKKVAEKFKNANWKQFFEIQKSLSGFFDDYGLIKAQKLEGGMWLAYYDTERKGLASIKGRFFPIYVFAAYCYAKGGEFLEETKDWLKTYKKRGLINAKFKCQGGKEPFEIKVEPDTVKVDSISYKVYVKTY